jgi:hypothetical protein
VRLSLADADTCLSRDASSREHAAFALGELCSSVVASETLRPLLLASPSGLALVLDSLAAICEGLEATHAELRYFAVPQFAPLTEAAGSIGQALKALPLGKPSFWVNSILTTIILPRQAQDKHWKSLPQGVFRRNFWRAGGRGLKLADAAGGGARCAPASGG